MVSVHGQLAPLLSGLWQSKKIMVGDMAEEICSPYGGQEGKKRGERQRRERERESL
jgi:hypothetical protein